MKKLLLLSSILLGTASFAFAQQGVSKSQLTKKNSTSENKKASENKAVVHLINATDQQESAEKAKKATVRTTK